MLRPQAYYADLFATQAAAHDVRQNVLAVPESNCFPLLVTVVQKKEELAVEGTTAAIAQDKKE